MSIRQNIRNLAIRINNFMAFAAFFLILIIVLIVSVFVPVDRIWTVALAGLGAVVGWALLYGFWFVLTGILDELKKLNNR
ncbi:MULTISPECIES: hypothetical protein [Pseudomonas]|uniref:hypothetical protein n=1 Tax=Pseudomonas TaxID=286 RepID=UPI000716FD56|nr:MULTISPECIES: hypothetical protein [Pseudomonas]WJM88722.1 hypothetical protein QDY63_15075 [Pseudomonas brenneri]WLH59645.1 hypothetical protein PSH73_11575 [Pseudomonas sp. FP2294]